jgi:hypothetical protein
MVPLPVGRCGRARRSVACARQVRKIAQNETSFPPNAGPGLACAAAADDRDLLHWAEDR